MTDSVVNQELAVMLDTLCPMHAILSGTGHIAHAGPALQKLLPEGQVVGQRFLEIFEMQRPRCARSMADLRKMAGIKLHLQLRGGPQTELKGVLMPMPGAAENGLGSGAIVNLSFGISVMDAVRDFKLTNADFAATDLAVEMLYLVESKSAAMESSRKLNLRLQGAKLAAEEQAFTDTLTGLKNRRAMDCVLDRMMETEQDFALLNLDLDFFKAVNDTLGHAAGDYVLQRVARVMLDETRIEDTIVRTGGDEFVLIFAKLTDRATLGEIADRLIARLERPMTFNGQKCRISASIGATLSCAYAQPELQQMMDDADLALYAAKDRGRGCHVLYAPALREEKAKNAPSDISIQRRA